MEIWIVIFRTIFLYVLITVVFRFMGKREIGELSLLDLVVFVMIGEIAVTAIEEPDNKLIMSILPILILLIIQVSLSFISLKSQKFRDLVDGHPSILIDQGQINEQEMKKQRYNLDDLLTQLREKDIKNIADVEFAILESSGKLAVFEKDQFKKAKTLTNIPLPLIKDGIIQEDLLERIQKSNFWLRQELKKLGYFDVRKIFYCSIDDNGQLFVDLKDEE